MHPRWTLRAYPADGSDFARAMAEMHNRKRLRFWTKRRARQFAQFYVERLAFPLVFVLERTNPDDC